MKKLIKNIVVDKRIIIVLFIFILSLFAILLLLKKGVSLYDETLPISVFIKNELSMKETVTFSLNDSTYSVSLDTNEGKSLKIHYRNGLNEVSVALSPAKPLIDDTLMINTRMPGQISIEIDKPTDELGFIWKLDPEKSNDFYFHKVKIKEKDGKRIKFAVWGICIE